MNNPYKEIGLTKEAAAWQEGYAGDYVSDDNFYDQDLRNAYVDGLKARQMEMRFKRETKENLFSNENPYKADTPKFNAWKSGFNGYAPTFSINGEFDSAYNEGKRAAEFAKLSTWNDAKQSSFNEWFLSLPAGRQKVLLDGDRWTLAGAAFEARMELQTNRKSLLEELLLEAMSCMDRARDILTDGKPRPECNWGMLATEQLRVKLTAGSKE